MNQKRRESADDVISERMIGPSGLREFESFLSLEVKPEDCQWWTTGRRTAASLLLLPINSGD